jgi:hypothetical protein
LLGVEVGLWLEWVEEAASGTLQDWLWAMLLGWMGYLDGSGWFEVGQKKLKMVLDV